MSDRCRIIGNTTVRFSIFEAASEIFRPLSPAVTAAGILKAVLALFLESGMLEKEVFLYSFLMHIAESPLYFLPVLLAYSSAVYFKCNVPCALAIGCVLIHPDISLLLGSLNTSLPFDTKNVGDYTFSVFPVIISILLMSYIERSSDNIKSKAVRFFLKPTLSVSLTAVFAVGILGPIGLLFSDLLSSIVRALNSIAPWMAPSIIGVLFPFMMITGTQYVLIPIGINNIVGLGGDRFVGPGMLVSNIAQSGAALAVAVRSNRMNRRYAVSSSVAAFLGISEPAMYGVNIKRKGSVFTVAVAGGVAGFLMGITEVERYSTATPGIISLTGYIGDGRYDNLLNTLIAVIAAFSISFLGTLFLSLDFKSRNLEGEAMSIFSRKKSVIQISSPLKGKTISLTDVADPTFSDKILGDGIAVIPSAGELYSPLDGVVESTADTGHAIAISGNNGAEILIHIGIDTVELKGEYFTLAVASGDKVKTGQLLIRFDVDKIKKAGYDTVTPVIITNGDSYSITKAADGEINVGDTLLEITELTKNSRE